jgi:hypothetical protein
MPRRSRGPGGFVLRSGYIVEFDADDAAAMVDHLMNAIGGESLQRTGRARKPSWRRVMKEVLAEIEHVVDHAPPNIARGLLISFLHEKVWDRMREHFAKHYPPSPSKMVH